VVATTSASAPLTPSKARAEVFDFPVEYYASPAVIVVNAKDDSIHSAKEPERQEKSASPAPPAMKAT